MFGQKNFNVGQMVAVRDDEEEPWQCARIAAVTPGTILVKRRPQSTPLAFKHISPIEALDDHAVKSLVGFDQQLRLKNQEANGSGQLPAGLCPEDQAAYNLMLPKSTPLFAYCMLFLAAFTPLFFNLIWLMLANVVNNGEDRQHFWWYALVFDNYFMILKGGMFTLFFLTFLPIPEGGHKNLLFFMLAMMWPLCSFGIHLLWLGFEIQSWGVLKLNFPLGASTAVIAWMPMCLLCQYRPHERFFALKRYVVIIVILVADLIFISSSHTFVLLFKAYSHGDFGLPESRVFRSLLDLLWLLAFTQLYMAFLGKVWQVGLFLFDTLAPFPDLIRQRMLYFATVILDMHRYMYLREMIYMTSSIEVVAFVILKEMIFDIYHFGIKTSPAFQSLQLMGVPSWQVFLGISKLRWSKYRCLERLTCLLSLFASFLEVPKELVAVFTWTIDAEYPHGTATYYFYFAETKVKLINVPATFDEKFRAWAFTKNAERERAAKSIRPTPVRFDLALANDAVHHSSEEWGKVCSMFADPCRFRFFQQLTIQLGGIVFCRYWPRMGCKLASSLMLLLAGPMIRLSPSKDVLNYVHDHTAPRDLVSWIVLAAMVLCDLVELLLVQWLQSADPAVIKYRLCKFARLFMDSRLLCMALSCHVCCNSDVYLTFAKLKF